MGEYDRAVELFHQSLEVHRSIGNLRAENIVLLNLASIWAFLGQGERALERLTQVVETSRNLGDRVHEGIGLGNMGDVYSSLERTDEAEAAWCEAIEILDDSIPAAAGAFRSSLALYRARQEKMDEARALLEIGEPPLRRHPKEHAKFLCQKGQVCHLAGDISGARAALEQAQGLAAELKVLDNSEVGRAVAALVVMLQDSDRGA
jgi:tetratricopeptide (TPR) repeat protein